MKRAPVAKLDKRNTTSQENLTITSCRQIMTSQYFFHLMVDLEQPRISDAWSIIPTFSLMETFYLTKTENRTKKFPAKLSYY